MFLSSIGISNVKIYFLTIIFKPRLETSDLRGCILKTKAIYEVDLLEQCEYLMVKFFYSPQKPQIFQLKERKLIFDL